MTLMNALHPRVVRYHCDSCSMRVNCWQFIVSTVFVHLCTRNAFMHLMMTCLLCCSIQQCSLSEQSDCLWAATVRQIILSAIVYEFWLCCSAMYRLYYVMLTVLRGTDCTKRYWLYCEVLTVLWGTACAKRYWLYYVVLTVLWGTDSNVNCRVSSVLSIQLQFYSVLVVLYTQCYTALQCCTHCTVWHTQCYTALQCCTHCTVWHTQCYTALQCCTHCTLLYSVVHTVHCCTVLYTAVQCCTHCTLLYTPYTAVQCCTHCTLLYSLLRCIWWRVHTLDNFIVLCQCRCLRRQWALCCWFQCDRSVSWLVYWVALCRCDYVGNQLCSVAGYKTTWRTGSTGLILM